MASSSQNGTQLLLAAEHEAQHIVNAARTDEALPLDKLSLKCTKTTEGLSSSEGKGKTFVVLVSTGSFNPPTYMHMRCFELARDAVNSEGFSVVGGYMSPVNDSYKKKGLICAKHRIAMCNLACRSSDFVMVDTWEASQTTYQRTLTILSRVRTSLCASGRISSGVFSEDSRHFATVIFSQL